MATYNSIGRFIIFIQFFCLNFAQNQCPSGTKSSVIEKQYCLPIKACDGYVMKGTTQCLTSNPSQKSEYGKSSVNCELSKNNADMQIALYICSNCPAQSPFGIQCSSCNNDQYFDYTGGKCTNKKDFPQQQAFLTIDKTSIVSECFDGQYYEELFFTEDPFNKGLQSRKECKQCPANTPFPNRDKTKCLSKCDEPLYILDKRATPNKCILTNNCKGFIFKDSWECQASCNPGEIFSETYDGVPICQKCPDDKPYASSDRKQCLNNCGQGFIYGEKQKMCIPLVECAGYIIDSNKLICLENPCQKLSQGAISAYFINPTKPSGQKYSTCSLCPINTPLITLNQPNTCFGCPQNQVADFGQSKCISQTDAQNAAKTLNYNYNNESTQIYPSPYCPSGQVIQSRPPNNYNYCGPCPKENPIPSPNQRFCCKEKSLFDLVIGKCIQPNYSCKKLFLSFDGTSCIQVCPSDQIKVEKQNKFQDQIENPSYFQCEQCLDPNYPFINKDQTKCLAACESGYAYSEKSKKCILISDCDSYLYTYDYQEAYSYKNYKRDGIAKVCSSKPCPSYSFDNQILNFIQQKYQKYVECIVCPQDQPFLEVQQANQSQICTRCLDKLRDYETGRCVPSISEISNPGTGMFLFNYTEFWPKRSQLPGKCVSINGFDFGKSKLRSCLINMEQNCNFGEVMDLKRMLCVKNEMCSLVLSRDKNSCKNDACKDDEIPIPIGINNIFPTINSNNGYLLQCSYCPQNKPYKLVTKNECVSECPKEMLISPNGKKCITTQECILSSSKNSCVSECGKGEGVVKYQNYGGICEQCPEQNPFSYQNSCYFQCPLNNLTQEKTIISIADRACIYKSACKGTISKSEISCNNICPSGQLATYPNKCVDSCQNGQYVDVDQRRCIFYYQCTNYMSTSKNECIEQCPQKQLFKYLKMDDRIYKQCVENCGNDYFQQDANQCSPIYQCENYVSSSKNECLEKCPQQQPFMELQFENIKYNQCVEKCPDLYYLESSENKCKLVFTCQGYVIDYIKCIDRCPDGQGRVVIIIENQHYLTCQFCKYNQYHKENIYFNNGACFPSCPSNKISNRENNFCIEERECKGSISHDKKFCDKSCSIGISVLKQYARYSGYYCECPDQSPYIESESNPTQCVSKCKIQDNTGGAPRKYCFDFQTCNGVIDQLDDGSLECIRECPKSQISEQVYDEKGNKYYLKCKSCPNDAKIKYNNQCQSQCPSPLVYYEGDNTCYNDKCDEPYQIFNTITKQCDYWYNCNQEYFVDLTNMKSVKECPSGYLYFPVEEEDQLCSKTQYSNWEYYTEYNLRNKCLIDFVGSFNSCIEERVCKPPRVQIQFKEKTWCIQKLEKYGFVFDKINSSQIVHLGVEKNKCLGVISSNEQNCSITCDQEEVPKKDERGFLKCTPCQQFKQFNKLINTVECVQYCKEGYISNQNKYCFPRQEICTNDKMITSDNKYCLSDCSFPYFKQDGKCILWQSFQYNYICKEGQIIDTTSQPPYKCIQKNECKYNILGNRCVITCLSNNGNCLNESDRERFFEISEQTNKLVNDSILQEGGLFTIDSLNRALMWLDWYSIQEYNMFIFMKGVNVQFQLQKHLETIINTILTNPLQVVNVSYYPQCMDWYIKIGTKVYIRDNQFNPVQCIQRKKLSTINLISQNLVFGTPDKIQVLLNWSFDKQTIIDTDMFGSENSIIQQQIDQIYQNEQNQSIDSQLIVVYLQLNVFCKEKQCENKKLFYINEKNRNYQIKFSIQPNSPRTICAYYENSNIEYKSGCISQDSKFILCKKHESSKQFISLYEDQNSEKLKEVQPICDEIINLKNKTSNDFKTNQLEDTKNQNIDIDINQSESKCKCVEDNDSSNELSKTAIAVIAICSYTFILILILGTYLIIKNKKNQKKKVFKHDLKTQNDEYLQDKYIEKDQNINTLGTQTQLKQSLPPSLTQL